MFSIIVAVGNNNEIGKDNKLLWNIPEDLQNFRKITTGKTVVMGRKTFESIGKLLPNRKNVILSKTLNVEKLKNLENENTKVEVYDSFNNFIKEYKNKEEEIFIIGGEKIYKESIKKNIIEKLYISYIDICDETADAYFPKLNYKNLEKIEEIEYEKWKFCVYNKISKLGIGEDLKMSRPKFSKKEILKAAYELMKHEGIQSVSVRKVAQKMRASTAPIYANFAKIDNLKHELIVLAEKKLNEYLYQNYTERQLFNGAIGFVIFAREERELFRAIFLDGFKGFEKLYNDTMEVLLKEEILIKSFPNLSHEEAKKAVMRLWYFIFGYASLVCTNALVSHKETNEIIENKLLDMAKYFQEITNLRLKEQLNSNIEW